MRMVTSMMASGKMTRLTASENILTLTVPSTKVTGSTISSMDRAKKSGQMVLSMKETTSSERKMASENSCGPIDLLMKATS